MARPIYNEFGERLDRFRVVLHAYCAMVPDNAGTLLIRYPAHEDEE